MATDVSQTKTALWRFAHTINDESETLLKDIEKYDGTEKTAKRIMDDIQTIEAWADITEKNYYNLFKKGTKGASLRGCSSKPKPKRKSVKRS